MSKRPGERSASSTAKSRRSARTASRSTSASAASAGRSRARGSSPSRALNPPPWLEVLHRHKPDHLSMAEVYRRLGWSQGSAYMRRRAVDLRLSEAAMIAVTIGMPIGPFLVEAALASLKASNSRTVRRMRSMLEEQSREGAGDRPLCTTCGSRAHRTSDHDRATRAAAADAGGF